MSANDNYAVELGERVIAGLYEENTGLKYKRQHVVSGRAIDARFEASLKDVVICDFRNDYGWCKLDKGHEGSHTVIFLGKDD